MCVNYSPAYNFFAVNNKVRKRMPVKTYLQECYIVVTSVTLMCCKMCVMVLAARSPVRNEALCWEPFQFVNYCVLAFCDFHTVLCVNTGNLVIHEFAFLSLSSLAVDFSAKITIAEKGGLPLLVNGMSSNDPDIQRNCVETLALMLQVKPSVVSDFRTVL